MMMVHLEAQAASTVISQDTAESNAPKMDPAMKAKWVEALRSGEYKQGRRQLRNNGSFCCLGVLCTIAGLSISRDGESVEVDGVSAGYRPIERLLGEPADIADLYNRNDGSVGESPHSFPEIADYIEKTL